MQSTQLQSRQTHHSYDQSWDDSALHNQPVHLMQPYQGHSISQPQQIAVPVHASRVRPQLASYRSYALHSMPNTVPRPPSYMLYGSPTSPETPQQPMSVHSVPSNHMMSPTQSHHGGGGGGRHMYHNSLTIYNNINNNSNHSNHSNHSVPVMPAVPTQQQQYASANMGPVLPVPYTSDSHSIPAVPSIDSIQQSLSNSSHPHSVHSYHSGAVAAQTQYDPYHIDENDTNFHFISEYSPNAPLPTHPQEYQAPPSNAAFMSSVNEDTEFFYALPELPPTKLPDLPPSRARGANNGTRHNKKQKQKQQRQQQQQQPRRLPSRAKKRSFQRTVLYSAPSAESASEQTTSVEDASTDGDSDSDGSGSGTQQSESRSRRRKPKPIRSTRLDSYESKEASSFETSTPLSSAQNSVSMDFVPVGQNAASNHKAAVKSAKGKQVHDGFAKPVSVAYPNKSAQPSHLLLLENGHKIYAKNSATKTLLHETLTRQILFMPFGEKLIDKIIDKMYEIRVCRNAYLAKQNEIGDVFFVVEYGKFVILQQPPSPPPYPTTNHHHHHHRESIAPKVIGTVSAKCVFGEESLLYNSRRTASYQAKEDSVVWALDCAEFLKVRVKLSKKRSIKNAKKLSFLRNVALFRRVRTEDILDVADAIKLILYQNGEHIITADERNTHLFMVYEGTCQRLSSSSSSSTYYEFGDYFGADAILSGSKSRHSVVAKSDQVICYVLNATEFKKIYIPKQNSKQESIAYEPLLSADTKFAAKVPTKLNELSVCGVLGVGEFGQVSLVEDRHGGGGIFALKKIRKNRVVDAKQEHHIQNERMILGSLNSAFCIALFATYSDELCVYFLLEAVLGGELFYVLSFNQRFTEKHARFYAGCVVLAFEHLHRRNVIFRDLKPENLLLSANGYLKLVDFGFAKTRDASCTLLGTPEYLAPEIISCGQQSFVTDWWCLGIFIFEMLVGKAPFLDDSCVKMYDKILTAAVEFPMRPKISHNAKDLITVLLRKHPYKRLGFGVDGVNDIQNHVWFNFEQFDWFALQTQQMKPPYLPKIAHKKDLSYFEHLDEQNVAEQLLPDDTGELFAWCNAF